MRLVLAVLTAAALSTAVASPAAAAPRTVVDGATRVQVLTPTLVRVQIGTTDDRPTLLTAAQRAFPTPRVRSSARGSDLVVVTDRLILRWRRGATTFAAGDLRVRLRVSRRVLRPRLGKNPAPLGGWRRSLDLVDGPVELHQGILSRAGWAVVDDSASARLDDGGRTVAAPLPKGEQDVYVFAYGTDLAGALRDLRALTGPTPLLPRKAFGVWFSRWWPYGAADWETIVQRFRDERVPLDTISLDTDFKAVQDPAGAAIASQVVGAPGGNYSWNAWDWNRTLFPDPAAFVRRAHALGLEVGLNVHPSIDTNDPAYPATVQRAGGPLATDDGCRVVQADPNGTCQVFDWADPRQLDAYLQLHKPFERDGIDFWWLDWCCDGSKADAPGLTPDTWINKAYADRQRARGSRWPAFSRIGGSYQLGFGGAVGTGALAEHAYTLQFTGDTCASWPLLATAAGYAAAAGSIGMAYVSHDIGSFHGVSPAGVCNGRLSPYLTPVLNDLPPEMYLRWVQLGVYLPLLRLHSHHGRRLPWEFGGEVGRVAAEALRERERLVPYLSTLARVAYDTGLPLARAPWLRWPEEDGAYAAPSSEFLLGDDLLVAPVVGPVGDGGKVGVDVWFPPGTWVDVVTGERREGPARERVTVGLDHIPVFARAGAVVPTQPDVATTPAGPAPALVLRAWRARSGTGVLADDEGDGLAYDGRAASTVRFAQRRRGRVTTLTIGAMRGPRFPGRLARRTWTVDLIGYGRPTRVTVDGRRVKGSYDAARRTITVPTGARRTTRPVRVVVRAAGA